MEPTLKIELTKPLPKGFAIHKGPNGNLSIQSKRHPNNFYSAEAWRLIEKGEGTWRSFHDVIFGLSQ